MSTSVKEATELYKKLSDALIGIQADADRLAQLVGEAYDEGYSDGEDTSE